MREIDRKLIITIVFKTALNYSRLKRFMTKAWFVNKGCLENRTHCM